MSSCALARAKLARYVEALRQAPLREQTTTAVRAGFVGSVVTPLRAVAGNASWGGLRAAVLQPTEAAFDHALSVARSARSGFKTSPAEFREVVSALDAEGLRVMGRGFRAGLAPIRGAYTAAGGLRPGSAFGTRLRTFVDELGARLDADPAVRVLEDIERVSYPSPVLQTLVDGAFAAVEAADRPFYRLAFDGSLYAQAKLYAVKQGIRGDARRVEVDRLLAAPTDEMIVRATDDAMFATFKDRGALATLATGAKRAVKHAAAKEPDPTASAYVRSTQAARQMGAKVADVALELNVPFVGVPSAVAARSAGMTPLGLLSLVADQTQAQRARTLAHASVGAAGLWLGAELYKQGRITGPGPTDPRARADERAAGRLPFAVRVGDHWFGVASLGPAAAPLFMGAALAAFAETHPEASVTDRTLAGAGATGRYLTSQTYLQNVQRLVEATQDERRFAGVVAAQIPTPSLLGQIERAVDPYPREARTLGERLLDRVPGGNAFLPRAVGSLGPVPARTPLERAGAVLSPFPVSESRDTPELAELRRLGVRIGVPGRSLQVAGERVAVPRTLAEAMAATTGAEILPAVRDVMADPRYQAMGDEDRAVWLRHLVDGLRSAARVPARRTLADSLRAAQQRGRP